MQSDSPCGGGQSIAGGYSVSPRPVGCGHTEQLSVHSKNLRQMNFNVCVCVCAYSKLSEHGKVAFDHASHATFPRSDN